MTLKNTTSLYAVSRDKGNDEQEILCAKLLDSFWSESVSWVLAPFKMGLI